MWLILSLTFLMVLLISDYLFKRRRYRIFQTSRIPPPSYTLPIIGNILIGIGLNTSNAISYYKRYKAKFGKVIAVWAFHRAFCIISDAKFFEVILSSPTVIKKPFLYNMLSSWLGDGLLLSYGPKWHARRKLLTPTYHFNILEGFIEIFDKQSSVLVKKLHAKADDNAAIDIFPIVCLTALDIISESAMGVEINAQENPNNPYAKAVKTASDIVATRLMKPIQYFDLGFLLTAFPSYLRLRRSIHIMHDFTRKVINDRRAKTLSQKIPDENTIEQDVGQKKRMAFLDVLLQSSVNGKSLSNNDICEEVDTFMFEGHDTTTSATSFCLFLLSRHAHIQQKVFEEVKEVLGSDPRRPITIRDLHKLKYLEAVIKETLRMYPSVPMIGREILEDIRIGNQVLPANTIVSLLIFFAARDGDNFPKPDHFKPERFYGESANKIDPFAYVPFSAGPRNCIGQKFAMLKIKTIISRVLLDFELLPLGPDVVLAFNLVLRSISGINLGLRPRNY